MSIPTTDANGLTTADADRPATEVATSRGSIPTGGMSIPTKGKPRRPVTGTEIVRGLGSIPGTGINRGAVAADMTRPPPGAARYWAPTSAILRMGLV